MDEKKAIPLKTKQEMSKILEEYAKTGVIGAACDLAGVRRKDHYLWLKEYEDYKEMFEIVRDRFVDGLELVAIERAKDKSDSLLQMLLKAHRREVYGDTSELNVKGEKGNGITLVFASGMLSEEEKKLLSKEEEND